MTLVKTMEGPQKTSSSSSTPVYNETLFWIFTLLPTETPELTSTFWPRIQRLPSLELTITWEKCQILVPSPISHGSSIAAVAWALYPAGRELNATGFPCSSKDCSHASRTCN